MRHRMFLAVWLCLAAFPAAAQELIRVDPLHAKVELENDEVRVLRIHVGPREKVPMHEDFLPAVVVYLTDLRIRAIPPEGNTQETQRKAGEVVWSRRGIRHAVENLSAAPYELIKVELKAPRAMPEPAKTSPAGEPGQADAEREKLEFENRRVRVLRIRVGPHEKVPMHERPARVVVCLTDLRVKVTLPDGKVVARQRKAGEVAWASAEKHAGENLSDQAFEVIDVEPKPAPRSHLSANVELLTPAEGVDFTPYLARAMAQIRRNWYAAVPEPARQGERGKMVLQFHILRNGQVPEQEPVLVTSSGKEPLDRAALSSIRAASPFEQLPAAFSGPAIELRLTFLYNLPLR